MLTGGIFTLDLASNTGWAHATPEAIAAWPALPLERGPIEGVRYGSVRFSSNNMYEVFEAWLRKALTSEKLGPIDAVVREAPIPKHLNRRAAEVAHGLAIRTGEVCAELGIEDYEKATSTLRKHFTGHGKGGPVGKQRTTQRCRDRGWDPQDFDAADALMILDYAVFCLANPGERAA